MRLDYAQKSTNYIIIFVLCVSHFLTDRLANHRIRAAASVVVLFDRLCANASIVAFRFGQPITILHRVDVAVKNRFLVKLLLRVYIMREEITVFDFGAQWVRGIHGIRYIYTTHIVIDSPKYM